MAVPDLFGDAIGDADEDTGGNGKPTVGVAIIEKLAVGDTYEAVVGEGYVIIPLSMPRICDCNILMDPGRRSRGRHGMVVDHTAGKCGEQVVVIRRAGPESWLSEILTVDGAVGETVRGTRPEKRLEATLWKATLWKATAVVGTGGGWASHTVGWAPVWEALKPMGR